MSWDLSSLQSHSYFSNSFCLNENQNNLLQTVIGTEKTSPEVTGIKEGIRPLITNTHSRSNKRETIICDLWLNNTCLRGNNCNFSHNPGQIIPTIIPHNFKSENCGKEVVNDKGEVIKPCPYNYHCNFSHHNEKIVRDNNLVYVQMPRNSEWVNVRIGQFKQRKSSN